MSKRGGGVVPVIPYQVSRSQLTILLMECARKYLFLGPQTNNTAHEDLPGYRRLLRSFAMGAPPGCYIMSAP